MHAETALVTGASSGIGRELANCFASDGCTLVLVARNQPALDLFAVELRQRYKTRVDVFPADLSAPDTPARLFSDLRNAGISIDVLVNNAGFGAQGKFAELPLERQLDMVQVNVHALTH